MAKTKSTIRRVFALIPMLSVVVALHTGWTTAGFAIWNAEMSRMQGAADAAALAGAGMFVAGGASTRTAVAYAGLNNPRGHPQSVAVEFGTFSRGEGAFVPIDLDAVVDRLGQTPQTVAGFVMAGQEVDAMRVTIVRTGLLGWLGPRVFGQILDWGPATGQVSAVAEARGASRGGVVKALRLVG